MKDSLILTPLRVALVLGSLMTLTGTGLADSAQKFTFRDAEFAPGNEGVRAAKSFVYAQLTPGLAMSTAIERVEGAGALCKAPPPTQSAVDCRYFILARPTEGDLGENIWSVKLIPGPGGTLKRAILTRSRAGMPGYSQLLID